MADNKLTDAAIPALLGVDTAANDRYLVIDVSDATRDPAGSPHYQEHSELVASLNPLVLTARAGQTDPLVSLLRADESPALDMLIVEGGNPAWPTESGGQFFDVRYGPNPGDGAAVVWRQMSRPPGVTTDEDMVLASMGTYSDNAGFKAAQVNAAGPYSQYPLGYPFYGDRASLIFDATGARVEVVAGFVQTGPLVNIYAFDGTQWFYIRNNGRMYDFAPDSAIHPTEMPAGGGLTRRWNNTAKTLTITAKAADGSLWSWTTPAFSPA